MPSMFEAARTSKPAATPQSGYVQPNLGHGLRIWWAFWWPTSLISGILTFGANAALRRIDEGTMVRGSWIGPILEYDAYLFYYGVALFVMAYILRRKFRDFRIVLLPASGVESAQPLRPTVKHTVRVWWTYSWRTILYQVIALTVVILPLSWFVGIFNPPPVLAMICFALIGVIVGGAVGLFAIYSNILDEVFGDFRVCLAPREQPAAANTASAASATNHLPSSV